MKLLLAEDEPLTRLRLSAKLAHWEYDVTVVEDGTAAWNVLQQPDAPHIAVLDWMMPGMDGVEVCRRVRQRGAEPYVYVVLLTGKDGQKDIVEGLEAGADDYVAKPFDARELEARLRIARRIIELQTELVAAREALRFQANYDALTGVASRGAVYEALRREVARAVRESGKMGVVMADVDHFKKVNDTYGHGAGDLVLCEVARRAGAVLRPYDTLGRYGGEEFLILLPGCDDDEAASVAERVRLRIQDEPVRLTDGTAISVTASFGVSVITRRSASEGSEARLRPSQQVQVTDPQALVASADRALYSAKRLGRNRVEIDRGGSREQRMDLREDGRERTLRK